MEDVTMRTVHLLAICVMALTIAVTARAQEIDWKKVDAVLGRTAAVSGDVHRYGFPRSDLFMHFWATDNAVKLAKALRAALEKTAIAKN
jgi:hypothetical protein